MQISIIHNILYNITSYSAASEYSNFKVIFDLFYAAYIIYNLFHLLNFGLFSKHIYAIIITNMLKAVPSRHKKQFSEQP